VSRQSATPLASRLTILKEVELLADFLAPAVEVDALTDHPPTVGRDVDLVATADSLPPHCP
jgi:hypothetical protein